MAISDLDVDLSEDEFDTQGLLTSDDFQGKRGGTPFPHEKFQAWS